MAQFYMATNPVLLYSHQYALPPIGRVINAEIHRDKGLFVECLLPKPAPGSFAAEVSEQRRMAFCVHSRLAAFGRVSTAAGVKRCTDQWRLARGTLRAIQQHGRYWLYRWD
jgi:hypothetical protein